jgi:hypothetical protein
VARGVTRGLGRLADVLDEVRELLQRAGPSSGPHVRDEAGQPAHTSCPKAEACAQSLPMSIEDLTAIVSWCRSQIIDPETTACERTEYELLMAYLPLAWILMARSVDVHQVTLSRLQDRRDLLVDALERPRGPADNVGSDRLHVSGARVPQDEPGRQERR